MEALKELPAESQTLLSESPIPVKTVKKMSDLPPETLSQIEDDYGDLEIAGFYNSLDKKIWIITDNVKDKSPEEINEDISHELLHAGFEKVIQDVAGQAKFLGEMYKNPEVQKIIEEEAASRNLSLDDAGDKEIAAEEAFIVMSRTEAGRKSLTKEQRDILKQMEELVKPAVTPVKENPEDVEAEEITPKAEVPKTIEEIITEAGGEYVGIQEMLEGEPSRVMFNEPESHSTIALTEEDITKEVVQEAIDEKRKEFGLPPVERDTLPVRDRKTTLKRRLSDPQLGTRARREAGRRYANLHLPLEKRGKVLNKLTKKTISEKEFKEVIQDINEHEAHNDRKKGLDKIGKTLRGFNINKIGGEYKKVLKPVADSIDTRIEAGVGAKVKGLIELANILGEEVPTMPEHSLRRLSGLSQVKMGEMSGSDLALINTAIGATVALNRNANKIRVLDKEEELDKYTEEMIKGMKVHGQPGILKESADGTLAYAEKKRGKVKGYFALHRKLENLTRWLDGKKNGASKKLIYDNLDKAEDKRINNKDSGKEFLFTAIAESGGSLGKKLFNYSAAFSSIFHRTQYQKIKISGGRTVKMTMADRISFYLTSLRKHGRKGLLSPKGTFVSFTGYKKNRYKAITDEDIELINNSMTENELAIAEGVSQFFNVWAKEKINETSNDIDGFDKAVEEDYFPVYRATEYVKSKAQLGFEPHLKSFTQSTIEGQGFLKKVEKKAVAPIVVRDVFEVIGEHLNKVSSYNAYARPLRDIKTVLKTPAIVDTIKKYHGDYTLRDLKTYITRIEDFGSRLEPFTGKLDELRGKIATSILSLGAAIPRQLLSSPLAQNEGVI